VRIHPLDYGAKWHHHRYICSACGMVSSRTRCIALGTAGRLEICPYCWSDPTAMTEARSLSSEAFDREMSAGTYLQDTVISIVPTHPTPVQGTPPTQGARGKPHVLGKASPK
jgi:hypothetical protein